MRSAHPPRAYAHLRPMASAGQRPTRTSSAHSSHPRTHDSWPQATRAPPAHGHTSGSVTGSPSAGSSIAHPPATRRPPTAPTRSSSPVRRRRPRRPNTPLPWRAASLRCRFPRLREAPGSIRHAPQGGLCRTLRAFTHRTHDSWPQATRVSSAHSSHPRTHDSWPQATRAPPAHGHTSGSVTGSPSAGSSIAHPPPCHTLTRRLPTAPTRGSSPVRRRRPRRPHTPSSMAYSRPQMPLPAPPRCTGEYPSRAARRSLPHPPRFHPPHARFLAASHPRILRP